ncbi:MAG: hypothetical protein H8D56_09645 [Planctomycetes bacterium]|nr:hypothetical protein [Planctomycetota bacterium]
MMSSQPSENPQDIIESIIKKLDETVLKKAIDEPIDTAAKNFKYNCQKKQNPMQLQDILSDFVKHIYRDGTNTAFAPDDTLAHTISLLDRYYQGNYSNGYTAAILDAINGGPDDVKIVLHRIAEIIKTVERERYISGIFKSSIDISDWHLRCRIVKYLLSKYKSHLTPALYKCHPSQLVDEIPYILSIIISSTSTLQQAIDLL